MSAEAETLQIDIPQYMQAVGVRARAAAREIGRADSGKKDAALLAIASAIEAGSAKLKAENEKDMAAGRQHGLEAAKLDRMEFTEARIAANAEGLREMALLPHPVGSISDLNYRPSGIQVVLLRVPLGVFGFILVSGPNVTDVAAGLCLISLYS